MAEGYGPGVLYLWYDTGRRREIDAAFAEYFVRPSDVGGNASKDKERTVVCNSFVHDGTLVITMAVRRDQGMDKIEAVLGAFVGKAGKPSRVDSLDKDLVEIVERHDC